MATHTVIEIENVTKRFGNRCVIEEFSTKIDRGTIIVILAPSGAGKTTLLRLLAGLDETSAGRITVAGGAPRPHRTGYIFQEDSCFPWLTVRDNVAFSLKLRRASAKDRRERNKLVEQICAEMGLIEVLDQFPSTVSVGQRQRCAIARALVSHPDVLLCDEPFSSLDDPVRQALRETILSIRARLGVTIVFVTHSVEEACFLADTILVCAGPPLRIQKRMPVPFGMTRPPDLRRENLFRDFATSVEAEIDRSWGRL